jgi:hypothetical protein
MAYTTTLRDVIDFIGYEQILGYIGEQFVRDYFDLVDSHAVGEARAAGYVDGHTDGYAEGYADAEDELSSNAGD